MRPKYADISDADATEMLRKRIGQVKSLLVEINEALKDAGGRE